MRPSQTVAMRSQRASAERRQITARRFTAASIAALSGTLALFVSAPAVAAPPAPCNGVVGISDDKGDGHHPNTDVLSAWFSEQSGRPQAVIKLNLGDWVPYHDDSDAAGFALLFEAGGQRWYVRVLAPRDVPASFDYGTWTPAGGFVSAGATTGEVVSGSGGTATLDVPAATGAVAGAVLSRPFVLTYDGVTAGAPHWVDRAPGGVTPDEAAFGADYVVGSCGAGPLPGGPGTPNPGEGPESSGAVATTGVVLNTPRRLVGAGRVRASGLVLPARGGVLVRLTATPSHSRGRALTRTATTLTDGSFAASIPLGESSRIDASADSINAQTRTVTVRSTVRMTVRRLQAGTTSVTGVVSPRLPGRVLLLRTDAAVASARATVTAGHFRFRARRLTRGRYQVVFIPSGNRAERSTSKAGVVR